MFGSLSNLDDTTFGTRTLKIRLCHHQTLPGCKHVKPYFRTFRYKGTRATLGRNAAHARQRQTLTPIGKIGPCAE